MKFSLKDPLVYTWIFLNVGALLTIGGNYLIAWHYGAVLFSINPEEVQLAAQSASREHLAKLVVDDDVAIRGALSGLFTALYAWLAVTLLNILITLLYCYRHKQRISPPQ